MITNILTGLPYLLLLPCLVAIVLIPLSNLNTSGESASSALHVLYPCPWSSKHSLYVVQESTNGMLLVYVLMHHFEHAVDLVHIALFSLALCCLGLLSTHGLW